MFQFLRFGFFPVVLALLSFGGSIVSGVDFYDSSTCSNACPNPCEGLGTCCFCDNSSNLKTTTCSCCGQNEICCPAKWYTKNSGSTCCPQGTECQDDGTCKYTQNPKAAPAMNFCGTQCKQDTTLNVTGDDKLLNFFIDGISQTYSNWNQWNKTKCFYLPGNFSVLAAKCSNDDKAGGFMATAGDLTFVSDASWLCTNSIPDSDQDIWKNINYDDSSWWPCCARDINDKPPHKTPRMQYDPDMSLDARWIWSNCGNGSPPYDSWDPTCYIRYHSVSYPACRA